MPIITIDFETRSVVDLRTCGAGRYAADDSTRILCVCWAIDGGPIMGQMGEEVPEVFKQAIREKWTFSAFNAMFEQLIWHYRWPTLQMPEFRCTRALVASHGLPQGLDRACKALNVGWSKDKEGTRLIGLYSKPREDGSFNEIKGEDAKKMLRYCAKDVDLSRRILQRLPALSPTEQSLYTWTVQANIRGVNIDQHLAGCAEQIASQLLGEGNEELRVLTGGTIFSVSQHQRIKNLLNKEYALETESLDKEAIEDLLLRDIPDKARRILELRRDLSQTSVQKFKRARVSVCPDGKVRDTLIYHGAATGRWASQVVQFQNLPIYVVSDPETAMRFVKMGDAEMFSFCYKSPMLALSGCIRGLVVPSEGRSLAIVDYAAIEARVLMWAAGQQDAVDDFFHDRDIYVEMAREIYQNKTLTDKNTKERFLGKTTVLGCGYQMGFLKFQATCENYGIDLGEKTEYVERKDKEGKETKTWYSPLARHAVETYRKRFFLVPEFWYGMQEAAELCVKTGKAYSFLRFKFHREREFLYLTLPSGRRLAYHRPGVDKDGLFYYTEDNDSHNYGKKRLYGGRLVENCVQAMARDILAHGILKLEEKGYKVVLTVHDENAVEISNKKELEEVIKIMCDIPEWAKGCPISAKGFVAERYRKG
jgi:DNA polymerase